MELFDKLKEGLLCPVCADIYKNPLNVRQCLHKFCLNCIEDYNRIYKKECPGCRAVIGSRRQLRKDECLQSLISALIKNTDKFNELENLRRQRHIKTDWMRRKNDIKTMLNKNLNRLILQQKAYQKDEEKIKTEMNKIKRTMKANKSRPVRARSQSSSEDFDSVELEEQLNE